MSIQPSQEQENKRAAQPLAAPKTLFERAMNMLAYPVSAVSGLWMIERDVNDSAYYNLKRYGAFNDILDKLTPLNAKNVDDRAKGLIPLDAFQDVSRYTRTTYAKQTQERMAHMGMTDDLKGFVNKWNYISRLGKREAIVKGLTVSGIAIGATLAMANGLFKDKEQAANDTGRSL